MILDVMLPDESGLDMFERIHRYDARIPILVISASGDSDTAIDAMMLGAFDYLLKPLDFPRVREVVEKALAIRRLMHVPVKLPDSAEPFDAGQRCPGRAAARRCRKSTKPSAASPDRTRRC